MAKSSSHNHSSPEITTEEEPVTLDRPESPNPFLHADHIEFSFDEIAFTTNNEVALLYPSHPNSEYFREVSDFISKCCLKESFTRAYLCKFWYTTKTLDDFKIWVSTPTGGIRGDIGITMFRNALRAHYLSHSSMYVPPLSITIVEATDGTDHLVFRFISLLLEYMMPAYDNEELTINPTHVFSVHNWALKSNQHEGPPFTDHMKDIYNRDVPVDSQAPKTSSQAEKVPQGKKPGAKSGLRRKHTLKHTSESHTEASKSKTSQLEKETHSSSAKDKSPSHPSPPIPVVGEMHKEAQQAAGGPTSFRAINKERARPQLSSDQTKFARDGLKTAHTDSGTNEESRDDEISKKIKLEDLSDVLKDPRSAFLTSNSPQDEPIIVLDESRVEKTEKDKDTHDTSHNIPKDTSSQKEKLEQQKTKAEEEVASLKARPSYLDINQLTELLVTSLKLELSKLLASHDFASCLPTKLKELPSKFTELSGDIKELKQHVRDMEIELPEDLKYIPTKLETFTFTISSLTS
ncbi:hypothetical protein Tco_1381013 [Tanacetum coccineum]